MYGHLDIIKTMKDTWMQLTQELRQYRKTFLI
nr:MAG TPA_asm: hypothetical protein [Caudoviricetes sp.]